MPSPSEIAAEPTPACPVCRHRGHTWAVCDRCRSDILWRLGDIVELHTLAQNPAMLQPPYGSGDGLGPVGGSHDLPMAADPDALDLALGEALLVGLDAESMGLEDWARDWRTWLGHAPHGVATEDSNRLGVLTGVIRYLRAHWPAMSEAPADGGHPAIDEFAHDVRRIHGWAMSALRVTRFDRDLDMLTEPAAFSIPCPGDDEEGRLCGHRLDVHRQPLGMDGRPAEPVRLNCPRCGTRWDIDRLRLVAQASGARPSLTHDEACAWLGTTPRGLAVLVRAGRVTRRAGRYAVVVDAVTRSDVG